MNRTRNQMSQPRHQLDQYVIDRQVTVRPRKLTPSEACFSCQAEDCRARLCVLRAVRGGHQAGAGRRGGNGGREGELQVPLQGQPRRS